MAKNHPIFWLIHNLLQNGMFLMIQSVVFVIVSPIAYVANELFPPFFFTGDFVCFPTVARLNFSIFLAYVIGERHYDVSAWFKAITLLMDIWLRVRVKAWYRRSGAVTRAHELWGLNVEFKGCRGVVERCVVEVTLVLRVQRLVLRVRRGTVWEWNRCDESVIKCKRFKRKLSPRCKRFFRPYN